jgi:WhiB family redox-sensing transcriptional regulator
VDIATALDDPNGPDPLYAALMQGVDPHDLIAEYIADRPAWMADAACREHPDAPYFPNRGQAPTRAVAVCSTCLVRAECLAYALADPDLSGVWGGTTEGARRALRRSQAAA